MKFMYFPALLSVLLLSCKKNEVSVPVFSDARYSIEITGKWKAPEFAVPVGVHFTSVFGMVHSHDTYLWKLNTKASTGVENIAETGNAYPILYEIDTAIATGKSIALIAITAPLPTGSSIANVYCTSNYSYISFETMLAPSPDWFTGINGFNLFENNSL